MIGTKRVATGFMAVIILAAICLSAHAAEGDGNSSIETTALVLKGDMKTLHDVRDAFDKSTATKVVTEETINGVKYTVNTYTSPSNVVLQEYINSNGVLTIEQISYPDLPRETLTINYDTGTGKITSEEVLRTETVEVTKPDGTATQEDVMKSLEVKYETDGTATEIARDPALTSNNTLTEKLDSSGKVIEKTISTTPGMPLTRSSKCTYTGKSEGV